MTNKGYSVCTKKSRRLTEAEFLSRVEQLHPDIKILSRFLTTKQKVDAECKICGHQWSVLPTNLFRGTGCPICANTKKRKTHEEFVNDLRTRNPQVEILGKYISYEESVLVKCLVCGFEWSSSPNRLMQGNACLKCAQKMLIKPETEFIEKLHQTHPTISLISGSYRSMKKNAKFRCENCNYEWEVTPQAVLKSQGCSQCHRQGTSFVEQYILRAFQLILGEEEVVWRSRKIIGAELDIYVPKLKFAIEPGAWYWHKKKSAWDAQKLKWCQEKGITLIRIFDQCREEVPSDEFTWVYSEYLSDATLSILRDLVLRLFVIAGIDIKPTEEQWLKINQLAKQYSKAMTKEEFLERLSSINQNIIVLDENFSYGKRLHVKCKVCDYVWTPMPKSLLMGYGCQSCVGTIKKTHDKFVSELRQVNDKIEVLGDYKNGHSPVLVRCRKCGYEWSPSGSSLLRGSGCAKCAGTLTKDTETFVDELKTVLPSVSVLGEYISSKTKIDVRCNECGYPWKARPNDLLNRHGCPRCRGSKKRTTEDFILELANKHSTYEVLGEYVSTGVPIKVRCKICGVEIERAPVKLLRNNGCSQCRKLQKQQIIESKIKQWRKLYPEGTKKDCMRTLGIGESNIKKYWD